MRAVVRVMKRDYSTARARADRTGKLAVKVAGMSLTGPMRARAHCATAKVGPPPEQG
jgi:hypothetical protein